MISRATMIVSLLLAIGITTGGCADDTPLEPRSPAGVTDQAELEDEPMGCVIQDENQVGNLPKASCSYTGESHSILASDFHRIGLTVCETHFPLGSDAREAVSVVIAHLNRVRGTSLSFYLAGSEPHTDYSGTFDKDGVNKIDIVDPDDCEAAGISDCSFGGRCRSRKNAYGRIVEFDLGFNVDYSWDYGLPCDWTGCGVDYFRNYMLHEVGHGLGLDHNRTYIEDINIMGSGMGKWLNNMKPGIKAFDRGHIRYHYPDTSGETSVDFCLSNFRTAWEEVDGSWYWKCKKTEGLSKTSASWGETVNIHYTRMNMGNIPATGSYTVTFYLSSDDLLSSDDIVLKNVSTGTGMPANSTQYRQETVTIPTGAGFGWRYVLVEMDSGDSISEWRENDNVLPIHEQLYIGYEPGRR